MTVSRKNAEFRLQNRVDMTVHCLDYGDKLLRLYEWKKLEEYYHGLLIIVLGVIGSLLQSWLVFILICFGYLWIWKNYKNLLQSIKEDLQSIAQLHDAVSFEFYGEEYKSKLDHWSDKGVVGIGERKNPNPLYKEMSALGRFYIKTRIDLLEIK